jgi:hypothetical protein
MHAANQIHWGYARKTIQALIGDGTMTNQADVASKGSGAYQAGKTVAEALKPGDRFQGALPAAERAGYSVGTESHRLFMEGFLDHLGWPLRCDSNSVILQIGE